MTAIRTIHVISDLHLGGADGFQMCPPEMRARLARFIDSLGADNPSAPESVELVVAGDFVDFLAEVDDPEDTSRRCSAFTADPVAAQAKLDHIIAHVDGVHNDDGAQVFAAFRAFTARGHRLTVLLGNHDLELSLPGVRERFTQVLTGDQPARFRFLFDGEALQMGDLIVDHGNRPDGWNQVPHDRLRRWRSAWTRQEQYDERAQFQPLPGSRLVVEVMNPLKVRYPFVDLLKPETEAVLPLLVALDPRVLTKVHEILRYRWIAGRREQQPGRPPRVEEAIADVGGDSGAFDPMQPAIWWKGGDSMNGWEPALPIADANAGGLALALVRIARASPSERPAELRHAFLGFHGAQATVSDMVREHPRYEASARVLAGSGPRTVVFGHTHLARDIDLGGGARYLNTGTWCDLIRLPPALWTPATGPQEEAAAVRAVTAFLDDLDQGRWKRWCDPHPTAARIVLEIGSGKVIEAGLVEVDHVGRPTPFTGYRPVVPREVTNGPA